MIKMYIGNEEVVCNKEFTISEELLSTSSTILNNCYPKSWEDDKDYVSRFYFPKDYSSCRIYDNDNLIFAGVVKNTGNISLNPRYPHYSSLQILDYKTLLSEGKYLDIVLSNLSISDAIKRIVEEIKDYGFVVGNIELKNNDYIGAYSTSEKTAYDVFQYLAEISQSKWFTRIVDENTTAIDFYDPELLPKSDTLQYNEEYFEKNNIIDMTYSYSTDDYRNKQIMLASEILANIDYTEITLSNGVNKTFTVSEKIGIVKNIYVNNVEKTFALKSDSDYVSADFYYTSGNNTFESNSNNLSYPADTQIKIVYTPLVEGRQVVQNTNEISRIKGQINRNGVISRYEKRDDVTSSNELNAIAKTYLKYKGEAEITLTVNTIDKDIFKIGDIVTTANIPISDLNTGYIVKNKKIKVITTSDQTHIWYTYELSSTYNSERAVNYFDNQRNKQKGNISQGEFITRNVDIDNTANIIFDNLQISEVKETGNNILNCILNAPFNN